MDAFRIHTALIDDYRRFTEGFVDIRDQRIRASVEQQSAQGAQWPDPWLSLNPSFTPGGSVDDLVRDGLLHPKAYPLEVSCSLTELLAQIAALATYALRPDIGVLAVLR
jgi:hypothetical protein